MVKRTIGSMNPASLGSAAISLMLIAVIGLSACGPQGGEAVVEKKAPETVTVVRKAPAPVVAPVGHVRSIETITEQGKPSGAGAVVGGVLGAVVGNQIGDGNGRKVATAAGAVGGAVIGNKVEKSRKLVVVGYTVNVEMPNGSMRSFHKTQLDGLSVGDPVRVEAGQLRRI